MIRVSFRTTNGVIHGFRLSGHAQTAPAGEDIVCAAVSSAAYMTVNTLTDVLHLSAAIEVKDGFMDVELSEGYNEAAPILSGFQLHMQAMQTQYPHQVQLTNTEV